MKYSRFNEELGVYDVFEDRKPHALNADLPVPKLPAPDNGIGVASRFAGRALPSGTRLVGRSWRPVGVVVASGTSGALGSVSEVVKAHPVIVVAAGGLLIYGLFKLYVNEMAAWGSR